MSPEAQVLQASRLVEQGVALAKAVGVSYIQLKRMSTQAEKHNREVNIEDAREAMDRARAAVAKVNAVK